MGIAFGLLAFVGIMAFLAIFYVRNGHIFGFRLPARLTACCSSPSSSLGESSQVNNYVAYEEDEEEEQ